MPGAGSAADQEGLEGLSLLGWLLAAQLLRHGGVLIILGFLLHNLHKL